MYNMPINGRARVTTAFEYGRFLRARRVAGTDFMRHRDVAAEK